MNKFGKIVVVVVLVATVAAVISIKQRRSAPGVDQTERSSAASEPTFPAETVLATVNGEKITLHEFENALQQLPAQYRTEYERQKHEFLNELITRKLLLKEARRLGLEQTDAYRAAFAEHEAHEGHAEHVLVDLLIRREVLDKVRVTDEDMRQFYEEHKAKLPVKQPFEQVKDMLRPSVMQQKQYEELEGYIAGLTDKADITRNQTWIEVQKKVLANNPLDRAFADNKPVLADFGRGTCIPCKMMKPILDELAKELSGRAHVLILDTRDYGYLARRFSVRIIPTQIFFDASGKELYRHQGFMSKEDILSKLEELGFL